MIWHEYVGNLHIHTSYSDGSGDVEQIVTAASKAHLDFIGINDHDSIEALTRKEHGWRKNVLVLVGTEVNQGKNHYLAYGVDSKVIPDPNCPQNVINRVNKRNGIGFIAHPFDKGSRIITRGRCYPWTDWSASGWNGIEVWNLLSQWSGAMQSLCQIFLYGIISPKSALKGADPEALTAWDTYSKHRRVVAVGGSDAHAITLRVGSLRKTFLSYQFSFNCVNMHILLTKPLVGKKEASEQDSAELLSGLANGSSFIGFDLLGDTRGFRYWCETDGTHVISMGGTATLNPVKSPVRSALTLKVEVPVTEDDSVLIRLMASGKVISESYGNELAWQVDTPGVYRVEVMKKHRSPLGRHLGRSRYRPWIYSNPIWVE